LRWRRFGDADRLLPLLRDVGNLGLGAKRTETNLFSQELENEKRKKAVLNSVWLIRKIQISYKMTIIINSFFK